MNNFNKLSTLVKRPLYKKSIGSALLRRQLSVSPKNGAVLYSKLSIYAEVGRRKIYSSVNNLVEVADQKDKSKRIKDIIIEDFKKKDISEAKVLIANSYTSRNPLCTMLHMSYQDHMEILNESVYKLVENKVAIVARDRNTNKIIATCLPSIHSRSDETSSKETFSNIYSKNIKIRHCLHIIELLKTTVNMFEKYSTVDKILEPSLTAVDLQYSGIGLFQALNSEITKRGKELGCELLVGQPTSRVIQKYCMESGGTLELELSFDSIEIDGKKVLDLERNLGITSFKVYSMFL